MVDRRVIDGGLYSVVIDKRRLAAWLVVDVVDLGDAARARRSFGMPRCRGAVADGWGRVHARVTVISSRYLARIYPAEIR